ncbi:MAG: hypothetical protein HPY82_22630 [Gammaproteobacteria bacterium]|nr:hypothetical protein [Gammaproteobacteria bacterium]
MKSGKWLYENGLSVCLFACFLVTEIGMSLVGHTQYNQQQTEHLLPSITYLQYLTSGAFVSATMENWESEFLQMSAYVLFTTFLYQKGSAESKTPGQLDYVDADPRAVRTTSSTPWPVRRGGFLLKLYENSLSIALLSLFFISFFLHAMGSAKQYNEQQLQHGDPTVSLQQYLGTAQFWFESLQNWQSEFFSVGMMVVLTIFLRQRGSPESKPVAMPHAENP